MCSKAKPYVLISGHMNEFSCKLTVEDLKKFEYIKIPKQSMTVNRN